MEVLYERCCGIDVHKRIVVACLKCGKQQEIREFGTTTDELRTLTKWLQDNGCQMIAMESTGSYWKPLYNIFELSALDAMVVNAHDMKNVPGRKTDVKDAEWIADLLQHGLLRASYIPTREQRELRELSRYRKSLIEERSRELNRLQKMLEGGNIKLASVVSDINGRSARNLLTRMLRHDMPLTKEEISSMLHGRLRRKVEAIMKALDGFLTPLQKQLMLKVVDHIDDMTKRIDEMDTLMDQYLTDYHEAIHKLDEVPGIGRQSAETILAEIGLDMSRFPTEKHFSSWAGLAPGNNESAKKRRYGRTTKGNMTLKTTLIQCAKSAVKKADSFLAAQYQRLVVRRGANRATVAVAHTMLIAIYHMLKDNVPFIDLGAAYYNKFNTQSKINHFLKKLKQLGWEPNDATTLATAT
ncbi:MAG: IS110 family transposase [Selenomonadaceae bacterium]|nr:IS110 family transposase [Selenomonadaceae bacterium]